MAFDVTPTSGAGPYTFTASYVDTLGIELGLYVTEFRSTTAAGLCPGPESSGTNSPASALDLLNTGTVVLTSSVPAGSCRRFVNLVRRVSDNVIVSEMDVYVDNIE